MEMQNCPICDEPVTNPICMDCLITEVKGWMNEKKKALVPLVESRAQLFNGYPGTGVNCIICGQEMNVCSHCFTEDIMICLQQDYPNLAAQFRRCFNFEHITPMPRIENSQNLEQEEFQVI